MDDSTLLLLLYVFVAPLGALAFYFVVRWVVTRLPGRTRRDLEEVKQRLATIEEIVAHLAKQEPR